MATKKAAKSPQKTPAKPSKGAAVPTKAGPVVGASAKYALASMTTSLSMTGPSIRQEGERTVFADAGVDVATMQLVGDELVVEFAAPASLDPFTHVIRYYETNGCRPGWLRFRRPATRDPRPDLEAQLASLIGRARAERRAKGTPQVDAPRARPAAPEVTKALMPKARAKRQVVDERTSIARLTSLGGPYLGLPRSKVSHWPGAADDAQYMGLQRGGDGASVITVGKKVPALVLGTPDALCWWPTKKGGVLVRVVSLDADDDAVLASHLGRLPKGGWEPVAGVLEVTEPWSVFDSAVAGSGVGGEAIVLDLPKGRYAVAQKTWKPDEGTELMLVRLSLAPTPGAPSGSRSA